MRWNKIWLFFVTLWCAQLLLAQESITLTNDSVLQFKKVMLVQEKYEKPYLKTDDGSMYRMGQVKAFQNQEGYFIKNTLTKNKNDFAERVLNGRVQIYRYDFSGDYIQMGQNNARDYYGYIKYEQPLKQMIYQNLSRDLSDNSDSMRKLRKVRNAQKAAPYYYVLGGMCIAGALVSFNLDDNNLTTPLFLGGVTFFAIPWILNSRRQKRMDDAVRLYNAT